MILKGTVEMTDIDGEVNTAQRSKDSDTSYFGELALIKMRHALATLRPRLM